VPLKLEWFYGQLEGEVPAEALGLTASGSINVVIHGVDESVSPPALLPPQQRAWAKLSTGALNRVVASLEKRFGTIQLRELQLYDVEKSGVAYVGLVAGSSDAEHGLGAMVHGSRIVEVGGADTGLLRWIAARDARE
jgi:hypothetical protein